MPTKKDKDKFLQYLWKLAPEQDDVVYHHDSVLPACDESQLGLAQNLCVHLCALGWGRVCTTKPPPFEDVTQTKKYEVGLPMNVSGSETMNLLL